MQLDVLTAPLLHGTDKVTHRLILGPEIAVQLFQFLDGPGVWLRLSLYLLCLEEQSKVQNLPCTGSERAYIVNMEREVAV